jgi:hypothetical protein
MKIMQHLKSMQMKIMHQLKSMHISQKHMYLIGIVVGAIILFSFLRGPREGFNNYISTGDPSDNADAKDTDTEDYNNSYVAPAGNTVLYNNDDQDQDQAQDQDQDQDQGQGHTHSKKCKHKNKKNKQSNNKHSNNNGPLGIPRSQIPEGDEDLYILKSQVIPPVCPACPNVTACTSNSNNKPPPCPPCARCPEPAFDCKKVPNYNSNNSEFLPRPVLADFSQFGM